MKRWVVVALGCLIACSALLGPGGSRVQARGVRDAARDAGMPAFRNQSIDVGGYHLHLHCAGTGSPAVIMDAGGGSDWSGWMPLLLLRGATTFT